ncbi:thialysine N-epsilon-acetyltransferase-like isoform X3 [Daphnia pulex]|uniref:thialysine N-epsilon-acetyltransferase-like isoform X3 n=1 Tax=Daphnia pulex TaxID=6669 RepID=UPI001EDEE2E7|nr:thialysine N-epsilon-acetyltransferase-like isoform X3 [Daphnia pulex]
MINFLRSFGQRAFRTINLPTVQSNLYSTGLPNDRKLPVLKLDGYTLRKVVKQDCEAIHHLVQELANCLNMPDAPQISAKALEADGFGSRRFYEGFVAESHKLKQVVGYAIYYFSYSTWQGKSLYMEDMYICPEDRKNRIAISFFHLISQAALAENCMRMNFCGLKDNKPAVELFQSLGADNLTLKEGWHYYRIPRHGIEELAQPSIITKFNP